MSVSADLQYSELLPDLVGSRFLVIGCGSVGRTTGALAHRVGATVIAADKSPQQLDRLKEAVDNLETHPVDVRDEESVAQMLDAARPDHILLSTGWPLLVPPGEFDIPMAIEAIADRVEPILAIANWVGRGGSLRSFTIVSGWAPGPKKDWSLWSFIAPGIVGLAENLTYELAPTRVNVVGPGPMVDTEMLLSAAGSEEARDTIIAAVESVTPARRAVRVGDTARQILFLAGDPVAAGSFRQVDAGGHLIEATGLETLGVLVPEEARA